MISRDDGREHDSLVRPVKFPLGQLVMTPGVRGSIPASEMMLALRRHARGDWGDVDSDDWKANDLSIQEGTRLLSAYRTRADVKFWIITEADRGWWVQETEDELPKFTPKQEDAGSGVEARAQRELRKGERGKKIEWSDFDAKTRDQVAGYLMKRFEVRRDHADDLVSGAMTKLMSMGAIARNPRGLLVTVSLHALYEEQRRKYLHDEHVGMLAADQCAEARNEPIYGQDDVASLVGEQETLQRQVSALRESLVTLSPADRGLLTDYYLGEKPLPEIRSEHGWTEDGAKSRLCRARERLRIRLRRTGEREM